MSRKNLWSLVAGTATIWVLVMFRGLYLQHAIISGVAVGALVHILLRTIENLKNLHKK